MQRYFRLICVISVAAALGACASDPEPADAGTTFADATSTTFPDATTTFPDATVVAADVTVFADAEPMPVDAGAPVDAGEPAGDAGAALLPYGSVCTDSMECETGLCDRVEMRNICTARCMNNMCPLPNSGCNNRGLCRPN